MEDSEEEEEDDTMDRMDACGEAPAEPPAGYAYAPCPPLDTLEQQEALKGRKILAAHILDGATGCMGTVQCVGVGPSWKQPDATHIVVYKKNETGMQALNGRVACQLTADKYGAAEWWLLLEQIAG